MILILFFVLVAESSAQLKKLGTCPSPTPATDFDEEKLLGQWYHWAGIENTYTTEQYSCGKFAYSKDSNGTLEQKYKSIFKGPGGLFIWNGQLIPLNASQPGSYKYIYPDYAQQTEGSEIFVDADWDKWVVLHFCQQKNSSSYIQFVWILTKSLDLDDADKNTISASFGNLSIPLLSIVPLDQHNCPTIDLLSSTDE